MSISLKEIHRWNPEKVTSDVLVEAFLQAETSQIGIDANIFFAQGLLQKFKGLMLSSMGLNRVPTERFEVFMSASKEALPLDARRWRIRCAQLIVWLDNQASELDEETADATGTFS